MAYGFWVIASLFRRSLDTKRRGYFSLIALYYGKITVSYIFISLSSERQLWQTEGCQALYFLLTPIYYCLDVNEGNQLTHQGCNKMCNVIRTRSLIYFCCARIHQTFSLAAVDAPSRTDSRPADSFVPSHSQAMPSFDPEITDRRKKNKSQHTETLTFTTHQHIIPSINGKRELLLDQMLSVSRIIFL